MTPFLYTIGVTVLLVIISEVLATLIVESKWFRRLTFFEMVCLFALVFILIAGNQ